MTEAAELLGARSASDTRIVGAVSAAHFVSHYYIILLPPLFAFVRADYSVSYTELGLALVAFNVVSATLQTPAGFLVDRVGARFLLVGGLLLGALAFMVAALVDSFWVLVAMFGLAGLANTVYHPADYAMLSHQVSPQRISKAYSIHTFAGMLGSTAAPASLLLMQNYWGWRGAFLGAALLGFAAAAILALQHDGTRDAVVPQRAKAEYQTGETPASWSLLLSPPILLNLAFFTLISLIYGGIGNYFVVATGALDGTPATTANTALSVFLLLSAIGVLIGGSLAARTSRHGLIAALGLVVIAALALLLASIDLGTVALILAMAVGGFFYGVMMPARDMIVRAVTPPGSFGKVFGFVTTGFNIGGIVSPLIFGAMMDHGSPALVFVTVAAVCVVSILTVMWPQRAD
jgi:MFS family permease